MEELFFQPNIASTSYMDRSKKKKMNKKRPKKNNWYDWLINYVPNPIGNALDGFKEKVVTPFKTNTPDEYGKQTMYGSGNRPTQKI